MFIVGVLEWRERLVRTDILPLRIFAAWDWNTIDCSDTAICLQIFAPALQKNIALGTMSTNERYAQLVPTYLLVAGNRRDLSTPCYHPLFRVHSLAWLLFQYLTTFILLLTQLSLSRLFSHHMNHCNVMWRCIEPNWSVGHGQQIRPKHLFLGASVVLRWCPWRCETVVGFFQVSRANGCIPHGVILSQRTRRVKWQVRKHQNCEKPLSNFEILQKCSSKSEKIGIWVLC
jgi:hypothetical protein